MPSKVSAPAEVRAPAASGHHATQSKNAADTAALTANLPYLRRYARAMTGSQSAGDAMVQAMLEAALGDVALMEMITRNRLSLFRGFSQHHRPRAAGGGRPQLAQEQLGASALGRVSPLARQALLLNQLEDFTVNQTGDILGVGADRAQSLVDEALREIARAPAADVMIIEDEPMIASHLEQLVVEAGHQVVASAMTAGQARVAFERHKPTLILSDVQLADGSSGIDAVEVILGLGPVPVIFITGFPEKLLTGERPEPAFLITKPFRDETVSATIGQAVFFGANLTH